MIHIGSISSGLSSAVMCDRLLQKHPDSLLVFEDVLFEDEDNYRFLEDCEKRWNKKIIRLKKWLLTLEDRDITIHIGFDYTEFERMERTTKAYAKDGYKTDYPLDWEPREWRPYRLLVTGFWGITPPRMYRMGYTHANCGGRCCKQGQGDWVRTLINFPERYAEIEEWERGMRKLSEKHGKRTILKRIKFGVVQELTLEQLRLEYEENNRQINFFDLDSESPCVVCGIGF
jgi:hypothetical protein